MMKESDMIVGQIVLDPWYYTGEAGKITSMKGRMVRVRFGDEEAVYDIDKAKKLLSVKRG